MRYLLILLLPALVAAQAAAADPAGMLVNAEIRTMDPDRPTARALAWDADGRILAVGDSGELKRRWPDVDALDAGGRFVVPGLIDAHGHVMGLGFAMLNADLAGAESIDEVIARLESHAEGLPDGAWLRGRGWDQTRWEGNDFPTAADLDDAFPERPVLLERVDGHASWANTAAMNRIDVDLTGPFLCTREVVAWMVEHEHEPGERAPFLVVFPSVTPEAHRMRFRVELEGS